jgi:ribosomal-protein-serine acetyltransferase
MAGKLHPVLRIAVGDGIELRPWRLEDAELLYVTVEANRARLEKWLPWPSAMQSASNEASFIRTTLGWMATGEGLGCAIVVDRRLAGGIGLNKIDQVNKSTELGYWLAEGFVGRGVMTRSTQALMSFAFEELGLHRVEIRAATGNTRSRAIPMRMGFTHEGTERESNVLNGEFIDLETYSMLSTEWVASALG